MDLLEKADPARGVEVAPPSVSASELIAMAGTDIPARPVRRRPWLVAATVATAMVAASAVVVLSPAAPPAPSEPAVIVPIGFDINENPVPAGPKLRELADRLVDAPSDVHIGQYEYLRQKSWGESGAMSEGHWMHTVEQRQVWIGPDNLVHRRITMLGPQYPDEASRRYWESQDLEPETGTREDPVEPRQTLPRVNVVDNPASATKLIWWIHLDNVLTKAERAELLRDLAGVPGFTWRGRVTDRAGRSGVAVTADVPEHNQRYLLVFDPETGELLAQETVMLSPSMVLSYTLFQEYDRIDTIPAG